MIQAILFDLDGTLVQTETLKALSYARAAVQLSGNGLSETDVLGFFGQVVGLSRREVATVLLERFKLGKAATARMPEFGVATPWQAFLHLRLKFYRQMLADPNILQRHKCPFNVGLLHWARQRGYATALATMSYCRQTLRVLEILNLQDQFRFVATREDVDNGKPDPEIYLLLAHQLGVLPTACLVIEDSVPGIQAALNAGMWCVAVTHKFTREKVWQSHLLEDRWIVDYPERLKATVESLLMNVGNS